MADRKYSRKEAEAILERAAHLESEVPAGGDGLSIDQLAEVAFESGIDPALVRRAAVEVELAEATDPDGFRVLGGPLKIVRTVTVPASNVDFDAFEHALQDTLDDVGHGHVRGDRLSWQSSGRDGRTIQAIVHRHDDVASIELTEKLGGLAGGLYGGVGGGLGGSLAGGLAWLVFLLWGALPTVIFVVAALLFSLLLARRIFSGIAKRRAESLDAALQKLGHIVAEDPAAAYLGLEESSPTLGLEESSLPDEVERQTTVTET